MRTVIEAMFNKLKTKSLSEITAFADVILPEVYSNIGLKDILSFVPNVSKYKVTESIGWPYDTKGITLDRWYGIPVTLESNVEDLHKELFDDEEYTVPGEIVATSDEIIDRTGYTE